MPEFVPLTSDCECHIPEINWMRSEHYHCKDCGAELECIKRIDWNVTTGVTVIGLCKHCRILFFEHEYVQSKWVPIT